MSVFFMGMRVFPSVKSGFRSGGPGFGFAGFSSFCFLSSTLPPFKFYARIAEIMKVITAKSVKYLMSLTNFFCRSTISPHFSIESSIEFMKSTRNSISGFSLSFESLYACFAYASGILTCSGSFRRGKDTKTNTNEVVARDRVMKARAMGVVG